MTTTNGTDHSAEPLVGDLEKLAARLGVSETLVPAEAVLKVFGEALGHSNRRIEALQREVDKLAERVAAIERGKDPAA